MGLRPALFMTSEGVPCVDNCSYLLTTSAHPLTPLSLSADQEVVIPKVSKILRVSTLVCMNV